MATAAVLPPSVTRHIADKLYDKRKVAALEVEQLVKQLSAAGNVHRISAVIDALVNQYATSSQSNARKGGLLCLAATAVALATPGIGCARPPDLLQRIVPPILASFTDQDSRVRYYAIESLWNVAKSTRDSFLQVFPDVFDALFRLCSDPDANVQNATAFLDRLVKDIVAESHEFDVGGFIPTLQEALEVSNPFKRQFLLGWLGLLDSLPDIDLAAHLPALLPGLLGMLSDGNAEVRSACTKLLQEFLLEVQTSGGGTDVSGLALILAQQLEQRRDEEAALLTALRWLHTLVQLAPRQLLPHTAALLREVLPCLGHADPDISAAARQVNSDLLEQVQQQQQQQQQQRGLSGGTDSLDSQALLAAVSKQLEGETEVSKLEALQWVHVLLSRDARLLQEQRQLLLLALCDALGAASDRVVTESLAVLASVAEQRDHFPAVMAALLDCFRGNGGARLLQRRGGLVIQQLSQKLGGLRVYRELSRLLQEEDDAGFAGAVVQALNLILLTSSQLQELRALLGGSLRSAEAADVFSQLFASWSYSCAASLSLALLAQAHTLAYELLAAMAQEPLSMRPETTVELTQLVSLLEAPAFAPLRLQLLQPQAYPALQRAVHGLLMLLPQGDAFRMLQARLAPIPIMAMLALREPTPLQPSSGSLSAAGSAAALAQSLQPAGSPAGSPRGSGTWAGLDPAAASPEQEGALSPRQRSQAQRPRLMQLEEKRLVQLFKSRASRLG